MLGICIMLSMSSGWLKDKQHVLINMTASLQPETICSTTTAHPDEASFNKKANIVLMLCLDGGDSAVDQPSLLLHPVTDVVGDDLGGDGLYQLGQPSAALPLTEHMLE